MLAFATLLALLASGCTERPAERPQGSPGGNATATPGPAPREATNARDDDAPQSVPSTAPAPREAPPPRLPEGVLPGSTVELQVPGDRPLRVVHAGPRERRALVYLPGMCGSTRAMDPWSALASHYGTMIILSADLPCEGRPGTRWPKDVSLIQARIDKALDAVKAARGGLLDTEALALVGYSQGAHRGEGLAARYPERYPYLILGGSPEAPSPANLGRARAVAILGGEREDSSHMQAGEAALRRAGVRSRFFLLPRAPHGDYGPEGRAVLGQVFSWMFDEAPGAGVEMPQSE